MQSILKSDIFFSITAVSIVVGTIIFVIFGFYLIRTMKNLSEISERLKHGVDNAADELSEMGEQIQESFIYRLLFGKKRKAKKKPDPKL